MFRGIQPDQRGVAGQSERYDKVRISAAIDECIQRYTTLYAASRILQYSAVVVFPLAVIGAAVVNQRNAAGESICVFQVEHVLGAGGRS